MPVPSDPALVSSLRERLVVVQRRIAAACARAGRSPEAVRLIGVTKTFGAATVRAAAEAGLTDFGENRVQELDEKASALPGVYGGGSVRWHLIGSLQRNKARRALELADAFHALDSLRLARELDRRAAEAGRVLPCYVQVNVSAEATKGGLAPDEALAFVAEVSTFEALDVVGLMTLAAPAESDEALETLVRPQFRRLRALAEALADRLGREQRLSMGMSGDFEVAVEEGATDVRLGTILFGER